MTIRTTAIICVAGMLLAAGTTYLRMRDRDTEKLAPAVVTWLTPKLGSVGESQGNPAVGTATELNKLMNRVPNKDYGSLPTTAILEKNSRIVDYLIDKISNPKCRRIKCVNHNSHLGWTLLGDPTTCAMMGSEWYHQQCGVLVLIKHSK